MNDAVPPDAKLLGYGPMLPLVLAGIGVWVLPGAWPFVVRNLAIIWAALLLAFIGGVRRGFGFASADAAKAVEITAAAAYLSIALLGLLVPYPAIALPLLAVGFSLAALLDRRAARSGNAPAWFATLRPPQLLLGAAGLALCWAWVIS